MMPVDVPWPVLLLVMVIKLVIYLFIIYYENRTRSTQYRPKQ